MIPRLNWPYDTEMDIEADMVSVWLTPGLLHAGTYSLCVGTCRGPSTCGAPASSLTLARPMVLSHGRRPLVVSRPQGTRCRQWMGWWWWWSKLRAQPPADGAADGRPRAPHPGTMSGFPTWAPPPPLAVTFQLLGGERSCGKITWTTDRKEHTIIFSLYKSLEALRGVETVWSVEIYLQPPLPSSGVIFRSSRYSSDAPSVHNIVWEFQSDHKRANVW